MSQLSGMTGFARAEAAGAPGTASAEARSVNGKGLDLRVRLPAGFDRLETEIKARAKARFVRGSLSININFVEAERGGALQIDHEHLRALAEAGRALVEAGLADKPRVDGLLALKGVLTTPEADADDARQAEIEALMLEAADEALAGLQLARREEGEAMARLLNAHIGEIEHLRDAAAAHAATQPEAIRDRIAAKFDELLPQGLDADKLAQEAASLAVRADVREELDRLSAHIDSARKLLAAGSPAGRKLDFLSQEFNREANTLCSKSSDRELTDLGLAMKAAVDQMREQVQNVE